MKTDPTNEELGAFINAMLSNLDKRLCEPEVIDEAIRDQRNLWVMLYRASAGLGTDAANAAS